MKTNENFLRNKEDEKKHDYSKEKEVVIKIIAGAVTFVLFIFFLIIFGNLEFISWLTMKIRLATGFDSLLAKSISLFLMAIFFGTPLGGFVLSFFPVKMEKKRQKRFIFLSVFSLIFLITYFTSQNVYFNPENGEPVKYYSIDIDGNYKFYSSEGFNTTTGEELKPVSREIIRRAKANIKGDKSQSVFGISEINAIPEKKPDKPREEVKLEEVKRSNLSQSTEKKTEIKKKTEIEKKKEVGGYAVSIAKNEKYAKNIADILRQNHYGVQIESRNCELIFINNSDGKFVLENSLGQIESEIPARKILRHMIGLNTYYLRSLDFNSEAALVIPPEDSFIFQFYNRDKALNYEAFFPNPYFNAN